VDSPWQTPLPTGEYITSQVVVYFHSEFWIPITCFCLSEAIALYHKALLKGQELLVFPPGLNLETKNILLSEAPDWQDKFVSD
jgi:hypothetical protein